MAAESDLKELSLRQQELVELQMMRTGENLDKINIAALDFGRAASVANPRIESTYTSWVVEGWVGRLKPIYCACESVQDVHIKHCHGTPQKKVLIELRHVCRSFLIGEKHALDHPLETTSVLRYAALARPTPVCSSLRGCYV